MTRGSLIAALMAMFLAGPGSALAEPAAQFHYGLGDSMRPDAYGAPGFQTQTPNEWGRPGGAPSDAVPYSRVFPERSGFGSSRDPARDPQGACRTVMMNAPDAVGRMANWHAVECRDAQGQSYILPGSQTNLGYY